MLPMLCAVPTFPSLPGSKQSLRISCQRRWEGRSSVLLIIPETAAPGLMGCWLPGPPPSISPVESFTQQPWKMSANEHPCQVLLLWVGTIGGANTVWRLGRLEWRLQEGSWLQIPARCDSIFRDANAAGVGAEGARDPLLDALQQWRGHAQLPPQLPGTPWWFISATKSHLS